MINNDNGPLGPDDATDEYWITGNRLHGMASRGGVFPERQMRSVTKSGRRQ
jgi:hypothetical protein